MTFRRRGRPRTTSIDEICESMEQRQLTEGDAQDKKKVGKREPRKVDRSKKTKLY